MTQARSATQVLLITALLLPVRAYAGAQVYEPLSDSVRSALNAAARDRGPAVLNFTAPEHAHRWLFEMSNRLVGRLPDRAERLQLLKAVHYEATRAGLDPQLVLGVIEVESAFRKYAVSRAGARGFMQVMPFWVELIGRPTDNLFHLRTNLRYGCIILRHYLDIENGDYGRALARYNGSSGRGEYSDRVLAHWKGRWRYDGPTG